MQVIGRFFIFYYVYYCYFLSKVMNNVIKKYSAIFFCRQKIPLFWILLKSFLTFFSHMLVGCMHALPSTKHQISTCDKYTIEIVITNQGVSIG